MSSASSKLAGITLVPHASLHVSKPTWWLESRFHFNFANFHDGKEQFGPLRVLNDGIQFVVGCIVAFHFGFSLKMLFCIIRFGQGALGFRRSPAS
jgi:hypothetical protein